MQQDTVARAEWRDVPPSLRPRSKTPVWPFFLGGFVLLMMAALAVTWPIRLPYIAATPGPVADAGDFIEVPDGRSAEGDLMFLTVTYSVAGVNVIEYLAAQLDPTVDLIGRERIQPAGMSTEDVRRQNAAMMVNSQQSAIFVALTQLGYEVTFEGSGALILSIVEGSAADGSLRPNDIIVAVDGTAVEFVNDTVDTISGRRPGDTITLTIQRPDDGDGQSYETIDVDITLGPFKVEREDGSIEEDPDRGMVGVILDNASTEVIFPVDVDIDAENIGGPSAGLMFTLEIMNQLSDDDLTKGHRIAGTGTIDPDGSVGAIGSVRQKVFGAIAAAADYLLVPAANFEKAVDAAGDDIEVVEVDTLEDALAFLDGLPPA